MSDIDDEICFDTTILGYAYDESYEKERAVCKELVNKAFHGEIKGVVSNQILGELFNILTNKIEKPVEIEKAEIIINSFIESGNWIKHNYDYNTIKSAIMSVKVNKSPFWDTVIAETMKENGINKIYTENDRDFKKIPGIKVINPLKR